MQLTGAYLVDFGVPLSIAVAIVVGLRSRSTLSKCLLSGGGLFFLINYLLILAFGYSCEGHAFIGYGRCSLFSDAVADLVSELNAFAVTAYLLVAGPLSLVAIASEIVVRRREGKP